MNHIIKWERQWMAGSLLFDCLIIFIYKFLNFSVQTARRILSNFKCNPKIEARLKILQIILIKYESISILKIAKNFTVKNITLARIWIWNLPAFSGLFQFDRVLFLFKKIEIFENTELYIGRILCSFERIKFYKCEI